MSLKRSVRINGTVIAVLISIVLQWTMLEISMVPLNIVFTRRLPVILLNLCVTAIPCLLLMLITGRPRLSAIITNVLCFIVSLINKYTCDLHGAPARISELATIDTGANVLHGYTFYLPDITATLLILLTAGCVLSGLPRHKEKRQPAKVRLCALGNMILLSAAIVICFVTGAVRPIIAYNWPVAVREWGYPLCIIEDTIQYSACVIKPSWYTKETAEQTAASYSATPGDGSRPDVIVILNETFYDPSRYTALNLETDKPYLTNFYSIEGAARGYAMIPVGGTNSTEYELLTSNAKYLINASAPFNFLNFKGANTIAGYMHELGYETWALHDLSGTNYVRYKAWPDMGFDHVLFQQDFTYTDSYGSRYGTDEADYRQLIHCYEQADPDTPRFMYLLTYQNHGGWEQNGPEWDTVHCLTDLGEDTDVMSEYLTGIQMSDDALSGLLSYFSTCGRDVVVLMVGDHPPVFLSNRSDAWLTENYTDADVMTYIDQTATPYLIWRNSCDASDWPETVTVSDLVPMTLKTAGLPLSGYYNALLTLQESYPVHIDSFAVTSDRQLLRLDQPDDYPQLIRDSLTMAYDNLQPASERQQSFFLPCQP